MASMAAAVSSQAIAKLQAEKVKAAGREDYAAAGQFKEQINELQKLADQLQELEAQKRDAAAHEDYAAAESLKKSIDNIVAESIKLARPILSMSSSPEEAATPSATLPTLAPEAAPLTPPSGNPVATAMATAHLAAHAPTHHSSACENGCGRPAFGKFRTCCTHCRGPTGPHARDCDCKITPTSALMGPSTPAAASSAVSRAVPGQPVPVPRAQAVPTARVVPTAQAVSAALASGQYVQPVVQPTYAQPAVAPVYAMKPTCDYGHRHHGSGIGMAAGVGAVGLAGGLLGGMMLERHLEHERYGYGGGIGVGGTEFVSERRGLFETDVVDVRRDMFGGTDIIEERRGLFGTDFTEVRTDMFGDREVIHEHVDMFGDVTYSDDFTTGVDFW